MYLSDRDLRLLDGTEGEPVRQAMGALVQLGEAFDAEDMVDIGYAHVHAGMALYKGDVELIEELATSGARMVVTASTNIANADMDSANLTRAPATLFDLQKRAEAAHRSMGSSGCFTCTPYWAGHWPTWNTHIASIESGVTVFANSILGARSNRDGFFAVYAGMTGRYPRFGLHLDSCRKPTHHVVVNARPEGTTDYTALGYAIGIKLNAGVPIITGLAHRPSPDELDALGVGMATSGGIPMFILPGVTPPYGEDAQPALSLPSFCVGPHNLTEIYEMFCTGSESTIDIVHLGCPHASWEEMRHYSELLSGRRVCTEIELWITTNRVVRRMATEAGLLKPILASGAKVISDTCPISCHFARSCSPDPRLGIVPPELRTIVVDSAKQAHYVRDMIGSPTLLTTTSKAVETAVTGRFHNRKAE